MPVSVAPLGELTCARAAFKGLNFEVGADVVHGIAHLGKSFVALKALKYLIRSHCTLVDRVDLFEVLGKFSLCIAFEIFGKSCRLFLDRTTFFINGHDLRTGISNCTCVYKIQKII